MKLTDNKNIFCSVSSGYSSVMMAIKLRDWYPDHNIINVMANTSKERKESLEFMNECDKHFNLNLKWIETIFNYGLIINNKKHIFNSDQYEKLCKRNLFKCSNDYLKTIEYFKVGVTYRIVNYKDLKVNGEIFESGIKKLGIPFNKNKWCTRDMKLEPMKKYANSVFGKDNYSIAVGLRADEIDRVREDYKTNNIFYPLINRKITTKDRNKFWSNQPIKITIPAYKGNCDLCFQKSNRKLMTILKEEPEKGVWWQKMIDKYGAIPKPTSKSYNELQAKNDNQMTFYRGYNTIEDLVKMAEHPFSKATDEYIYQNDLFDQEDECGSGCQVF